SRCRKSATSSTAPNLVRSRRMTKLAAAHPFDVEGSKRRLAEAGGGYEVVHESPGLEIGVYVLVAPEPDRQQPHVDDEVYVVLEGTGRLDVGGTSVDLREGHAAFVPAGAEHRFSAYEHLSVLVIFDRRPGSGAASTRTSFDADEARSIGSEIGIDWDRRPLDVEQFRAGFEVELVHGASDHATY